MENRTSMIELLEDLTSGKDYELSKKTTNSYFPKHNQNAKPKIFDYDHRCSSVKSNDYNHQSSTLTSNVHGNQFHDQKPNNDFSVSSNTYPSPWSNNCGPVAPHGHSGYSSPKVMGYGLHSQVGPPNMAFRSLQSPCSVSSVDMQRTLNNVPFSPNPIACKSNIHFQYGEGNVSEMHFPHFDRGTLPIHSGLTMPGAVSERNPNCSIPYLESNKFFQQPYYEYVSKGNVSYPYQNINSSALNFKDELSITNIQKPSLKLNLLPPPSPPNLLNNYKNKNVSTERAYKAKNTFPPLKGPHTPPSDHVNISHSENAYSPIIGPRTPPLKGKGPCTPPQIGPRTPPIVGPHTPPLAREYTHHFKGPHTPPFSSPYTPSSQSLSSVSDTQSPPPLPPSPIPMQPPLPSTVPTQEFLSESNIPHSINLPKNCKRNLKIMRRRSKELSSSDSDSSDKPDTSYPDYKRNINDSPENFHAEKYSDPFNHDFNISTTTGENAVTPSISHATEVKENKHFNCHTSINEQISSNVQVGSNNYFYGSSYFVQTKSDDSCDDLVLKKKNCDRCTSPERKIKLKSKKEISNKRNVKENKENLNSSKYADEVKFIPGNSSLQNIEENPKNNFPELQFSDRSCDLHGSNDNSLCSESPTPGSGDESDVPFIKYSDYEELLNLETKRLTMEQESSQENLVSESIGADEMDTFLDSTGKGSPILYDLPDDSPPASFSPNSISLSRPSADLDKPKYPRYFKDKVAYTSSFLPPFTEKQLSPEQDYNEMDHKDFVPRKELPRFDELPTCNKNIVPSESTKVAKTPLIKRLGLVGDVPLSLTTEQMGNKLTGKPFQFNAAPETQNAEVNMQLSLTPSLGIESITKDEVMKETKKPVRKLVIVENQQGKLTKVKLTSPSYSENVTPLKLKHRDSKEFPQSSRKDMECELATPKGRGYSQKSHEKKNVKESPMRLDLDSRIKILFGTKSESPQKSNNINSPPKYHFKNYPPLPRPPSPFCNRNLYLYWHRETYYFRKHNPIPPPGSVDPMVKRKIGIQIKHQTSQPLKENKHKYSNNANSCSDEESMVVEGHSKTSEEISLDAELQESKMISTEEESTVKENITSSSDQNKGSEIKLSQSSCKLRANETRLVSAVDSTTKDVTIEAPTSEDSLKPAEITRIDVLPNNELEFVSQPLEIKVNAISDLNNRLIENDKVSRGSDDMIKMVMDKIMEDFRSSLKRQLTEYVVSDDLWETIMPQKMTKTE